MRRSAFPVCRVNILCALALLSSAAGAALSLASLINQDATSGLKAALDAGSAAAVARLSHL